MSGMTAFDELVKREMVEQVTNEESIAEALRSGSVSIYVGFDPSAPSLHVGHLLPIMALAHLQRYGHRPIVLVGSATGMIGDPSGRDSERELLTAEAVEVNSRSMKAQLERFVSFEGENAALMVNNLDWIGPMSYIEWLREVGKHFSVNAMIAKESVRRRLNDREQGISYTEFSYMLLQAYDFLHLFSEHNCLIQGGGSDQWGNITAGIDLIRRAHRKEAFGITFPLVTSSSGEKFGKSAGNAVWLDPEQTSPYQFYQYWIRADDRDVEKYLKYFTFLPIEEIDSIVREHQEAPHQRNAQRILAMEITRLVHGEVELKKSIKASEILYGGEIEGLSDRDLLEIFDDVPSIQIDKSRLTAGVPIVELLIESGMVKSKGEARRLINGGGVYLNNQNIKDTDLRATKNDLASETVLVLRTGKKRYHLIRFE